MKRKIFKLLGFIAIAALTGFTLAGCESAGETLYTGTYNYTSVSTEQGQVYTFYNHSSHPVTLSDDTGSYTVSPGDSVSCRFNRSASIYNVDYSPVDLVSVSQSGGSFTFRDK
ncbi:MAG: hypothetical protein LBO80_05100 [Treponema sp.]|jgi:hypothetical protein|nr:hypothetical protein [Treponema sp.]